MSDTVKNFSVGYNRINKSDVFTSGDYLTGQVTFDLTKDCKIESLCVKLKGKASVLWTEYHGQKLKTYSSKEKYFSIKQFVIQKDQGSNIVSQGSHVYPFAFQIPAKEMPSSFRGRHGSIWYTVEANLSRSMRRDSKAEAVFTFLHKADLNSDPALRSPQHSAIDKKMKLFNKGTVSMDVNLERTGYHQGEDIKVVASIQNSSTRDIKPKYCFYQKCSFFVKDKRKVETKNIQREVGEVIPPSTGQTVTKTFTIPPTTSMTMFNCSIIKTEYRLRIYLDVKYALDPEIKFPIVILPVLEGLDEEQSSAYGSDAFPSSYMPGGTSFLQNPAASGPYAPPSSYDARGMYPALTGFDGHNTGHFINSQ